MSRKMAWALLEVGCDLRTGCGVEVDVVVVVVVVWEILEGVGFGAAAFFLGAILGRRGLGWSL